MSTLADGNIYTLEQKIDILWKKHYGMSSTDEQKEFFQEDMSIQNKDFIIPDKQIWKDELPDTAPEMLYTDEEALGVTNPIPGITYSHIVKYQEMELEHISNSFGKSYKLTELKDSVPFTYSGDGSYQGTLFDSTGSEIKFGIGSWKIDHNTGILTFFNYDAVSSRVASDKLPKITFFRYEGDKGLTEYSTIHDSNEEFNDGIIIDNRDFSTISTETLSNGVQFGDGSNGSWRMSVRTGVTESEDTTLVMEKMIDNIWTSITEMHE